VSASAICRRSDVEADRPLCATVCQLLKQRPEQTEAHAVGREGEDGYDERAVVRAGGQHVFVEEEQCGAALQSGPNDLSSYLGPLPEAHPEHTMTGPEASVVDNT